MAEGPEPTSIFYLLKRAHLAARALADDALVADGLSVAQYAVLRRLEDESGLSGAELARRCYVTAPTMNGLIASLVDAGFIERFPDPQGGRGLLAQLTAAGLEAVTRGRHTTDALEERLLSEIGPGGKQLLGMLRRCAEAADGLRPAQVR